MKIKPPFRLPWAGYPPDKQVEISREYLRSFLKTEQGRVFFAVFLKDHFYFDTPKTEEEQALRNYATFFIKERLGIDNNLELSNSILDSKP